MNMKLYVKLSWPTTSFIWRWNVLSFLRYISGLKFLNKCRLFGSVSCFILFYSFALWYISIGVSNILEDHFCSDFLGVAALPSVYYLNKVCSTNKTWRRAGLDCTFTLVLLAYSSSGLSLLLCSLLSL